MATATSNKESTRRVVNLLNKQEIGRLDELFVRDVVTHADSFSWQLQNRDELKAFVMDLYDAFPDVWWDIDDLLAEDETVVVRYTIQGTHRGSLVTFDLDPTGEVFQVDGIQIYRFQEDRIVESWLLVDMLGLMRQLDIGPPVYSRGSNGVPTDIR